MDDSGVNKNLWVDEGSALPTELEESEFVPWESLDCRMSYEEYGEEVGELEKCEIADSLLWDHESLDEKESESGTLASVVALQKHDGLVDHFKAGARGSFVDCGIAEQAHRVLRKEEGTVILGPGDEYELEEGEILPSGSLYDQMSYEAYGDGFNGKEVDDGIANKFKVFELDYLQLPVDSTLPGSVQLKVPAKSQASAEQSLYKNLPQGSVYADRTFPAGCERQCPLDMFGGSQKSVQNFIAETSPGVKKPSGGNKTEQQRKEEVKYVMNTAQGIKISERVHVRKDLDGKLKQMHIKGTSSMLSLDRVTKSSIRDQGSKPVTTSTNRNSSGKYVEDSPSINHPAVQKYAVMKPSTERATVQTLKPAPDCPWKVGKHTYRPPMGFAQLTSKAITKKRELVVGGPSNFLTRKSYAVVEDRTFGHKEEDDSPLFRRSGYRERAAINTLSGQDVDIQGGIARNRVMKILRLFQTIHRSLLQDEGKANEVGRGNRVDLRAATILKENNKCLNVGVKFLGTVPGVEIGDEFRYRVELTLIGLHSHYENGIDYLYRDGKALATIIVASGRYDDMMVSSDVLVYCGQGGRPKRGSMVPKHQKLVRGNLALKNSMDEQTPVRVIHRFLKGKDQDTVDARTDIAVPYTYDGLYLVEDCREQKGDHGKNVYMFQMRRIPGQRGLAIKEVNIFRKAKMCEGICVKDFSYKGESIPIEAANTIDKENPQSLATWVK